MTRAALPFTLLAVAPGAGALSAAVAPGQGFEVERYAVALRPDPATAAVSGTETIVVRGTSDRLTRLAFTANALRINGATADSAPVQVSSTGEAITFTLLHALRRGGEVTLRFRIDGRPARGVTAVAGGLYTSYFACGWMVCLQDAPGDKAHFALDLFLPAGAGSIGVGRAMPATALPGGLVLHRWRSTRPYPPHLYAFAAGPFARRVTRTAQGELAYLDGTGAGVNLAALFAQAPAPAPPGLRPSPAALGRTGMTDLRAEAMQSKAWPFEEARKLLARWPDGKPGGEPVLFETGYGPSGLPHIGTFTEVLRTTMVRRAYVLLSDAPTRLVAFSDDMDGLRKVPDNVPEPEMLAEHLGRPLSRVPDPFGTHESFAAHNNARLRDFLDRYGFDYEFVSATDAYASGRFDDALRLVLARFDQIMGVMLPTLRAERRATYSPVLPISPATGAVLQVPVEVVDADAGLIRFTDADGRMVEQSALSGRAKLQWKVDWAMRWVALGVDYEMAGKDLIDSVVQSGRIARVLGGRPPEGFNYEMFLDEAGEKISKSKGNGLSMDDWLRYGPEESLAFYLYREPKKAKSLHLRLIPRAVDDYWQFRQAWAQQPARERLGNPAHHIHDGRVPGGELPVTFGLLLNLVGVMGDGTTPEQVWGYLANYVPDATPERYPELDRLIPHALRYARDVAPAPSRRAPTPAEAAALAHLDHELAALPEGADAEVIQNAVYEVGKTGGFANLRDWFRALYETLLGSEQGPRMGSFISLYGVGNTRALIADALARA